MEKKKKKKIQTNYVLLCISDAPTEKVKKYKFSRARINFLKALLFTFFLVLIGYVGFSSYHNTIVMSRETVLKQKVSDLEEANKVLQDEKDALTEKVAILSETVNQKVVAEKELEEKNMPTGFPLSGTADMEEKEETVQISEDEEETRPLIHFKAADGVFVVASGAGVVTYVEMDNEYGYQVQIDHGNGYVTVYRSGTEPKVSVGDEVARNALLYEMIEDEDNELADVMGYQIIKDGKYVVPTDVLEING